jgi:hypothetical protein
MTCQRGLLIGIVLGAFTAAPASAQDDPKFGLLVSFPSPTVSVQWEMSERFAIRVEGSYSFRDDLLVDGPAVAPEVTTVGQSTVVFSPVDIRSTNETTSHTGSIGVAGIYTMHRSEQFRIYLAPRVSLGFTTQRVTATTTASNLPPGFPARFLEGLTGTQEFEASSTSPGAGVSLGAASNVNRRLALFGEAGFSYVRTNSPRVTLIGLVDPGSLGEGKRTTLNTRAVAGVMFMF